jgi:exopolysaccharide biosynthesis polyprenyl glycosylphosphotransferase
MATMHEPVTAPKDIPQRRSVSGLRGLQSLLTATEAHQFSIIRRQGAWRDALLRRMLAIADLSAGLLGSISLAVTGTGRVNEALWTAALAPVWLVTAKLLGLYDRDQRSLRHLTVDELPSILTWSLAGTAGLALLLHVTPAGPLTAGEAVRMGIVSATAVLLFRAVSRAAWRRITPPERAIIVGEGALATAARRKFELFPDIHIQIAAELPELLSEDLREAPEVLRTADRILLATSRLDEHLIAELVAFCRRRQIKLSVVPPARGMFGTAVELNHIADLPVVEYNTWDVSRSTQLLKRVADVLIAAAVLVVLSPICLLIALLVLIQSGRPVFFRQARAGQDGKPFLVLKFRTMVPNAEELLEALVPIEMLTDPMFKLRGDPRVTWVGRLLRRSSLDELPQLVNVLKGDMSLVGPRPEQLDLVQRYEKHHLFRLGVKPGLTGPMQVYGRGELTFEERLAVERDYIENMSLGRDLHILALTVSSVFHGRGAF